MQAVLTSSRIRVLPDLLVNKIAAGEVVERPASVVKELLENAIDAGASRVSAAIEEGGRRLIRVTDDGCGMTAADLRLAVAAHATSKVATEDDLYSIRTMGFRGEALASIAAVSHLRIVSCPLGNVEGHEIRMAGDRVEASMAAGCPVGTTVEVRELFFNVPARRKFLRAPSTEAGHITEQFLRVALAYPQVGFELASNARTVQNLPPCATRAERIAKFYGPELASSLLHVERNERGVALEIFAGPPSHSRATTQWQYLFVNGRFIRDRSVQHAIKEAYRGLMEPDRHGVVFLFLELDPTQVDVNVHPTKIEVRWADSQLIYSQVLSALRETFQRCDLTPRLSARVPPPVDSVEQERIRQEFVESIKSATPGQWPARTGESGGAGPGPPPPPSGFSGQPASTWREAADVWRPLYGAPEAGSGEDAGRRSPPSYHPSFAQAATPLDAGARPRAIQMHNLYLVAETDDGIVIIDQHALHERVMYEQLRDRIATGPLESQRLLLPESIRVTARQSDLLEANADLLHRLGIETTPFSADSIAVHTFPSLLKDTQVVEFMSDLLDLLAAQPEALSGDTTQTEVLVHKILDLMACKAAVKAGDPLTPDEIATLVEKRHLIEKPSSCPHGRPTTLRLTKADLNRQFKRV